MNILSVFAVGLGLSMDNFAVTLASGCACRLVRRQTALAVSLGFTAAHVIMLTAGWSGGAAWARAIDRFDHWIAFFVLLFIGAKMVKEAFEKQDGTDLCAKFSFKMLCMLSVATSLDALLVGMALSLANASFWLTLGLMSLCVFVTSYSGFFLGGLLGRRFGAWMEALGGVTLAAAGTRVLLSGLGIC